VLDDSNEEEWDSTCYDMSKMTYWTAFTMIEGSAFENKALWGSIGRSCLVSLLVACLAWFTPYATVIDSIALLKLGALMAVFIGVLLGFFLSSSIQRWYNSTHAFMQLLDSVRNLQMQMAALGVAEQYCNTISRYGMLSAWLLNLNLHLHCHFKPGMTVEDEELSDQELIQDMWNTLDRFRPHLAEPQERTVLMQYNDSYALVWTWVASLVGRMSADGDIPPMASPTYGRILDVIQQAYASLRDARTPFLVKAPFVYIHTLVILVHINGILNATLFGIQLGGTISFATTPNKLADMDLGVRGTSFTSKVAELLVAFCINMIAPALYLTLLSASMCMSQPFQFQDAKIPLMRLLVDCEHDLESAKLIAADPPLWKKPKFQAAT